jgi:hypothetical protein
MAIRGSWSLLVTKFFLPVTAEVAGSSPVGRDRKSQKGSHDGAMVSAISVLSPSSCCVLSNFCHLPRFGWWSWKKSNGISRLPLFIISTAPARHCKVGPARELPPRSAFSGASSALFRSMLGSLSPAQSKGAENAILQKALSSRLCRALSDRHEWPSHRMWKSR